MQREAPKKPGIYFFFDKDNRLLYIGRAKNLYNRMKMHLDKHDSYMFWKKVIEKFLEKDLESLDDEEKKLFEAALLFTSNIQAIDRVLYKVHKVAFVLMDFENAKQFEKEWIKKLKPPYNYQSNSKEYDEAMRECNHEKIKKYFTKQMLEKFAGKIR